MAGPVVRIQDHFQGLTDPRRREATYPLVNIVVIALCGVISGADDFVSIARWAHLKKEWLARFLDMSAGVPSHDRFNAILGAIKPAPVREVPAEENVAQPAEEQQDRKGRRQEQTPVRRMERRLPAGSGLREVSYGAIDLPQDRRQRGGASEKDQPFPLLGHAVYKK